MLRYIVTAVSLAFVAGVVVQAQTGGDEAGLYWINIKRQSSDYFVVNLGIEAKKPLRIRAVRVPDFVDASLLPQQREVFPLISTEIRFPIRFIDRGSGRLYLEVRGTSIAVQAAYLVFDLYHGSDGAGIRRSFGEYANRWKQAASEPASLECGDLALACGASLSADASNLDLFRPGKLVSGVMLSGCAGDLAEDVQGIDATDWGLRYATDRSETIVGSFVMAEFEAPARADDARPAAEERREEIRPEQQAGAEVRREPKAEQEPTRQASAEEKPKPETEGKPEGEEEPESGTFSGASRAVSIAAFSANSVRAKQMRQDGRFGETAVTMPPAFFESKRLDKAELVLRVSYTQRSGAASGRIFINSYRSIEPKDPAHDKGAFWYGDKRIGREQFLGDFSAESTGKEYRFDITNWIQSNLGEQYFIVVENLAVADIDVSEVRIEFSGER